MTSTLPERIAKREADKQAKAVEVYLAALAQPELDDERVVDLEAALAVLELSPADFAAAVQIKAQLEQLRQGITTADELKKLSDQVELANENLRAAREHLAGVTTIAQYSLGALHAASGDVIQRRQEIARLRQTHSRILNPGEKAPTRAPEPRVVQTFSKQQPVERPEPITL